MNFFALFPLFSVKYAKSGHIHTPIPRVFLPFHKKVRKNVGISFKRALSGCMINLSGTDLQCIRSSRAVFQGLSFYLESGDVLYLTGPNGSGKSSLLRIFAGLLKPSAGVLSWNGESDLRESDIFFGKIHYIGHRNAVKVGLSVLENLSFWSQISGGAGDQRALTSALKTFELDQLADLPARFLSAGQARRLALARLLVKPAPLWVLDEPATSLDIANETALQSAIHAHSTAGGMAVIATHEGVQANEKVLDMAIFGETAVAA